MDSQVPEEVKVVVHDLNNILNIVLNSVELLKETIPAENKSKKLLENIESNTLLASNLILQISGKDNTSNNYEKLNLTQIIKESVNSFENRYKRKIKFTINSANEFFIIGNTIEIKRMMLNLFTNSKEANCTEIEVCLRLNEKNKEHIKLSISDNGNGVSEDFVDKIFGLGFTTKNKNVESGMGLSIVKTVMENHEGWIELNMNTQGGTTFDLFFPNNFLDKKISKLNKKTILVAEDDPFQREVLSDLLKSLEVKVFSASNGSEALELFISEKPDLLFIDEFMPGMSGMQCSKKIREVDKKFPIVLLTGSTMDKNDLVNISKLLKKPYNFESIRSTLFELL